MDADDELELLEAMYADDVDVQRSSGDNALLERIDVRLRSDGASMTLRLACDGGQWRTSIEAWRGPMSERSRVATAARGASMLEIVDAARDAGERRRLHARGLRAARREPPRHGLLPP